MAQFVRRSVATLAILLILSTASGCSSASRTVLPVETPQATAPSVNEPVNVRETPQPVDLSVTLDESAQVSALVPQKGGEITMTLANGLVYTLSIPEGALLSDQEVTMTPIRSVEGMPLSGGEIAGVQLEPDGTALIKPAQLTISVPEGYDLRHMVGFGYHGQGEGFHLSPAEGDGSTITIQIMSFSGHGAAAGTDDEVDGQADQSTGSAADDYQQEVTKILQHAKARGDLDDWDQSDLIDLLKDYYDNTVQPYLKGAVNDDSLIDEAAQMFLQWERDAETLSLAEELKSRIDEGTDLMVKGLKNAFDQAAKRCVDNQNIREVTNMYKRIMTLELLGASGSDYTMEGKRPEFDRCLRLKVNVGSVVTMDTGADFDIISHVTSTVVLKLENTEENQYDQLYRGKGDLKFVEYKVEFTGALEEMNQYCSSDQTSEDGSLEIFGKINVFNLNSPDPKINALLAIKPSNTYQTFPQIHCNENAPLGWIDTLYTADGPIWLDGFDLVHKDIKMSMADLIDVYVFSKFDYAGGDVIARFSDSKTVEAANGVPITDDLTIDILGAPGAE